MPRILLKERGAFGNADTGGAWLSSACAVRCWVKSRNERNPLFCFKKNKNDLSAIIAPSVIFTQGFATSGILTEMHQSAILVPALQSHWLMMHVSMMIFGYVALLCGSLLYVGILVITFGEVIQILGKSNNLSQFIQQLDRWSYRIISLDFLFLTIGILSGVVWANETWGSYWNWDPKKT
ncbi:hypothetical protein HN51_057692 [Arachis hypogaea]